MESKKTDILRLAGTLMHDALTFDEIINQYTALQERCMEIIRNKPDLMGSHAWLKDAISTNEIMLIWTGTEMKCYGTTWTRGSRHEYFEFTIPDYLMGPV